MAKFRINYYKVISQANDINQLAGNLNNEIKRLESFQQDIKSNWQGSASDTFLRQTNLLLEDLKKTKYKTANLSSRIKSIALRIQKEDELAVKRARQLAQINNN